MPFPTFLQPRFWNLLHRLISIDHASAALLWRIKAKERRMLQALWFLLCLLLLNPSIHFNANEIAFIATRVSEYELPLRDGTPSFAAML